MNDKTLVIVDAGHGGIDSGAVGNNLKEKDLTLEAAKYMFNRLKDLGINAVMTRTDDEYLPKRDRINRILSLYNNNPNTLIISNHINAGGAEGAEVVYSLKSDGMLANMIIDNIEEAGQIKRKAYQRRLPENPSLDYYYIIRETGNAESVLVEYGFIDNKNDVYKLENNLEDFVEGTVKAIAEYLGVDYVAPNISSNGTYTVKKGDTLYSISRKYNIPIDTLISLNNLTSSTLKVGQVLKLTSDSKGNSEDTEIYQVKRGDTLYNIASRYNTTVDNLKNINNLTSNTLTIGQNLLVPKVEDNNDEEDYDIYTVQKGDSLWSISRKYDMPVNELIEINNLTNLTLKQGQQLLVPKQEQEDIGENIYVVQKGDTLWSIANKLNIPVNTLKELNNLTSNLLTIGQQLIIQ